MKKHLIAVGLVAVFAAPAMAQNVTVYGALDGSYASDKTGSAAAVTSMANTGNDHFATARFGVKGGEDLGGGLKAVFNLESDLGSATGAMGTTGQVFNRLSFVGLESAQMGSLYIGRQNDAIKDTEGLAQVYNLSDNLHNNTEVGDRYTNVTKYQSPAIAGFKVAYSYSNNPTSTDGTSSNAASALNSFNVTGKLGAIEVAYASGNIRTAGVETKTARASARTTVGAATVGVSFTTNKKGSSELNQTMISGMYPLGHGMDVRAHYVNNDQTGAALGTKTPQVGGSGTGLMLVKALSKRTSAYAGYSDFGADAVANDRKVTTVGVYHSF